jgi:hypothetical protein
MPNLYKCVENLIDTLNEALEDACDIERCRCIGFDAQNNIDNALGIAGEMKVLLDERTSSTSISLVVVDNGDSDMEYWAFFDGDHAASFAALRGGDIEDITVMGESDALTAIDNEEDA